MRKRKIKTYEDIRGKLSVYQIANYEIIDKVIIFDSFSGEEMDANALGFIKSDYILLICPVGEVKIIVSGKNLIKQEYTLQNPHESLKISNKESFTLSTMIKSSKLLLLSFIKEKQH